MATHRQRADEYLKRLLGEHTEPELVERLSPKPGKPDRTLPRRPGVKPETVDRRWDALGADDETRHALADPGTRADLESYRRNIENLVGTVKVPVGVAGPMRVNGLFAQGDYFVPLATTEAALVASYHRGACLLTEIGGCTALLLEEGMSRAPGFVFANVMEAGTFVMWALENLDALRDAAQATTRHGKLKDVQFTVEGNHVYVKFDFETGDASGQNMVTIATEAICAHVEAHCPMQPAYTFVEANLSGDKKASAQSYLSVRGKKVTAEAVVPAELVAKRLHTTPRAMADYWQMSALGGVTCPPKTDPGRMLGSGSILEADHGQEEAHPRADHPEAS
ncbi:MAG TPA: hypothetical protein VIY27_05375 [Myxococcota bacterium]